MKSQTLYSVVRLPDGREIELRMTALSGLMLGDREADILQEVTGQVLFALTQKSAAVLDSDKE